MQTTKENTLELQALATPTAAPLATHLDRLTMVPTTLYLEAPVTPPGSRAMVPATTFLEATTTAVPPAMSPATP